ncbi:unnamed protein product [Lota lota]
MQFPCPRQPPQSLITAGGGLDHSVSFSVLKPDAQPGQSRATDVMKTWDVAVRLGCSTRDTPGLKQKAAQRKIHSGL